MNKIGKFDPSVPTHVSIFRSWKSMKPWVMTWLWFLNAVYWLSIFWIDRIEAQYALVAYFAVLPFALCIVIPQRGLTRLSGLIHIPFLLLLVWLAPRLLTSGYQGLYGIWLHLLFWSTAVCVVFDFVDVVRWFRGEHYRLGTPEAVERGASRAA